MMLDIYNELLKFIDKDKILKDEPMALHTSFKIGGKADFLVKPSTEDEIISILKFSKENDIPVFILGNGSNILVRDGGIRGITIKPNLQDISIFENDDDVDIIVGAGYPVAKLSRIVSQKEIAGLEFLSGIPGTIGGAVKMNAGAYGSEMKDCVVETKYMDYDGNIYIINAEEHEFGYRRSIFSKKEVIILETKLKLNYGEKEIIDNKINEITEQRKQKQPITMPSAGRVFKRGDGFVTARLIDECGLKGFSIGGAEVSTMHAGFIVNKGNATANDVIELIEYVKNKVKEKYNVDLELEVLIVGEDRRKK